MARKVERVARVTKQVGPGLLGSLFLVLLVLKVLGFVTVSWWWVTAPLWGPIAFIAALAGTILLFGVLAIGGIAIADAIRD